MRVDWTSVLLQGVNFLVLVALLKRFLYAPILDVIARRRAEVEKELAEAAAEKERARAEAARASELEASAVRAGEAALERAHAQAKLDAERLQEAARREAERIVESGRKLLAEERDEVASTLEESAARLSVSLAERLLADLDRGTITGLLLDRTVARIESLPAERLGALGAELRRGGVTVATAAEVAPDGCARIAERLARSLGVTPERVSFTVEPSLVAGAEVRLPASSVVFTWRGALAELAREVTRGHAR